MSGAGRLGRVATAAVALLASWLDIPARANDGDSSGVSELSRIFAGNPNAIVVAGPLAYLALDTGLRIVDVSDPRTPIVVGELYLPSRAMDLALAGTLVFIANDEAGLAIVDASDASRPRLVGRLATSGTRAVAVAGGRAYLGEASSPPATVFGLRVVNVSDPTAPVALGFLPLPNGVLDVSVSGSIAYAGIGSLLGRPDHGLATIDVSTPTAPTLRGFLPTGSAVNALEIAGTTAFLATGFPATGAFVVADVSLPSAPALLASLPLADAALGLDVAPGVAYVAAKALGLVRIDVTAPGSPFVSGSLQTGRETRAVSALGVIAFLAEGSSNGQARLTAVSAPPGSFRLLGSLAMAEATGVAAEAGLAYLLRRDTLHIFDATLPGSLVSLGSWTPLAGDFASLAVSGGLAAVGEGSLVHLIDVSDPMAPIKRGSAQLEIGTALDLALRGTTLFVVDGRGFEVFDVTSPSAPVPLANYRTSGWSASIALDGPLAYLAAGSELHVVSVASPSAPLLLASLPLPDQLYSVAVLGSRAVLGGLVNRALVVDITTPAAPSFQGALSGGPGLDVSLVDATHALVAGGAAGLLVVDLTSPSAPSLAGYYDTSGTASAVAAAAGGAVYLATQTAQHWVLDALLSPCIDVAVSPLDGAICAGEALLLDSLGTSSASCDEGLFRYQWYEDSLPIPGATAPRYSVPASHATGSFTFRLDVLCSTSPACTGSRSTRVVIAPEFAPAITPNSLRLAKLPSNRSLSWKFESPGGEANVHRTLSKAALPPLYLDGSSLVGFTAATSFADAFAPPGAIAYYRVFGRLSCSGGSSAP